MDGVFWGNRKAAYNGIRHIHLSVDFAGRFRLDSSRPTRFPTGKNPVKNALYRFLLHYRYVWTTAVFPGFAMRQVNNFSIYERKCNIGLVTRQNGKFTNLMLKVLFMHFLTR